MYDEGLFIDGVDFDFFLRLRSFGWKTVQVNDAYLFHQIGESRKTDKWLSKLYFSHTPIRRYYQSRNTVVLFRRYFKRYKVFCFKAIFFCAINIFFSLLFDKCKIESIKNTFCGIKDGFHYR